MLENILHAWQLTWNDYGSKDCQHRHSEGGVMGVILNAPTYEPLRL
jgi:hypothetical protein